MMKFQRLSSPPSGPGSHGGVRVGQGVRPAAQHRGASSAVAQQRRPERRLAGEREAGAVGLAGFPQLPLREQRVPRGLGLLRAAPRGLRLRHRRRSAGAREARESLRESCSVRLYSARRLCLRCEPDELIRLFSTKFSTRF